MGRGFISGRSGQMTPRNSEPTFNEALCRVLWTMNPGWRTRMAAEQEGALIPRGKPDIVLHNGTNAAVVIESEYLPAASVEDDARKRINATLAESGERIEQSIALRVPDALKNAPQPELDAAVRQGTYQWCLLTAGPTRNDEPRRWPSKGWVTGSVEELADLIEHASVSERAVAASLDILETGIRQAATRLANETRERPDVRREIASVLRQEDGEQTMRMAMTILANALTFQSLLAGFAKIPTLGKLRHQGVLPKHAVVAAWEAIQRINYAPIFRIAESVLAPIPDGPAARILDQLGTVAGALEAFGVTQSHDVYGRTFQRLISDRKFLATFYTRPAPATLLAELAVGMMDTAWDDTERITNQRICDLACGTGTLITAAYRAIGARHRRAGGDDEQLHQQMMENVIVGADIVPAATHLTTSMLAMAHPRVQFEQTQVHLLPYGAQPESGRDASTRAPYALGALDLTNEQHGTGLFEDTGITVHHGTNDVMAVREEGKGWSRTFLLEHQSMDLVIMNPPFTRPTNHKATAAPVPSFAGLGTEANEQAAMSKLLHRIRGSIANPAGHGNAGLASSFLDIAHAKVRPGGILAMVMPLSLVQGASWEAARKLLTEQYKHRTVIGLAAAADHDKSFSADTGMGEVLLTARRRSDDEPGETHDPITFVALRERPRSTTDAAGLADAIQTANRAGARRITIGDELRGVLTRGDWGAGCAASILHGDLAEQIENLKRGLLKAPRTGDVHELPVTPLGTLGTRGLLHRDISGTAVTGYRADGTARQRGPFDIVSLGSDSPTFPVLWSHHRHAERHLIVSPDSEATIRPGADEEAATAWATASRLHFSLDFRLNAQSLAACMTVEPTLGGRAWPNVRLEDPDNEPLIALWANSTLGLLLFWWDGKLEHAGRSCLTISQLPDLTVLDARKLDKRQRRDATVLFRTLRNRPLRPAYEADQDETRRKLDEELLTNVLRLPRSALDAVAVVRRQWCNEPTVHGTKANAGQQDADESNTTEG